MNYAAANEKEQYKTIMVIPRRLLLGGWVNTNINEACILYYVYLSLRSYFWYVVLIYEF